MLQEARRARLVTHEPYRGVRLTDDGERVALEVIRHHPRPGVRRRVAYVDPGNFATNIAGGAKYGYLLLWVIVAANLMAMLIQTCRRSSASPPAATCPSCAASTSRAGLDRALGPGRADRDGDRPRRVRRRGDRAQPAVRRPALPAA
jgi:hypothetical protein